MKIVVIGLNHKSADVELRERLAFDDVDSMRALARLNHIFSGDEFALLSTCNRVEAYRVTRRQDGGAASEMTSFICDFHGVRSEEVKDILYAYEDAEAVRHLLSVASSLDSMVVGEPQIVGQVKDSYRLACETGSTGKVLNRLFHCAFRTAKKVHSSTTIAQGRVSVPGVAVQLAAQLFRDIASSEVVVLGAGEMGELIIRHLLQEGCRRITVLNRSAEKSRQTAQRYDLRSADWDQMVGEMTQADIVLAAAAGKRCFLTREVLEQVIAKRRKGPLLIIDVAVPRNCDPSLLKLPQVYLYDMDDLSEVARRNTEARRRDIAAGARIVSEDASEFMEWFKARDVGLLIGQMRRQFEQISRDELDAFFVGNRTKASCKAVLETMVKRIVNKLLHCVIAEARETARSQGSTDAARLIESIVRQAGTISSQHEPGGSQSK